ncbi:MAG: DNA/RNA non-specific endonuclease [Bacteroidales bacterium]|nr:DNA/RNA non-specific endonuclease [Lachnoclostridium sp.]MCM1385499.1 DNA/RNA non-specific endonuclease [Lachnoclostridium sp.]MCM1466223.1 DNA/RNA non-specific endonuclease [Bacteroidales bacterium]
MKSIKLLMMAVVISIGLAWSAYSGVELPESESVGSSSFSIDEIAPYSGTPYIEVNNNIPYFSETDLTVEPFERYSDLDEQGRCGTAYANICTDIMPTEAHGEIGQIRPSGWHTVKYNDIIDGNYLYNRCHLIGYQLAGENANEKNLITGTRYLNVQGMLPYENRIADYVTETGNHVLYRVTPVFEGDNLLASGVLMEAESVEDKGDGILFCVYVYNVQPGIIINYASGESGLDEVQTEPSASESSISEPSVSELQGMTYILNTNTKKFHYPSCPSVDQMKEKNKQVFTGNREDVLSQGYAPCKNCNP